VTIAAAWFGWCGAAVGACLQAPDAPPVVEAEDSASGPALAGRDRRMVAPVLVNGEGPFRFIVDTGANRSVLSDRLAQQLDLAPVGEGQVNSVYGVATAPLAQVETLSYGDLALPTSRMPILQGPALAGEEGLLGVDGMRGRRLLLDFQRRCIEITPSDQSRRLRGWSTLEGELRFGHLMMVDGSINGQRVNILIDTGSDTSLANNALRAALDARLERGPSQRLFAFGEPIVLEDAIFLRRLEVGELRIANLLAYVGDFHIFSVWGLLEEPTLLLGMDVLSRSRAMAIDYGRGTVHFRLHERRTTETVVR
jgi:predicted aspartyl protease